MKLKIARVSAEQAAANAAAVRALWKIGTESNATNPTISAYGNTSKALKAEIVRLELKHSGKIPMGMNIDTVPKARRIASLYSKREIDEIADLIVTHQSRFSATHLVRCLAVADAARQKQFAKKAIEKSYSSKHITRLIQVSSGHRRPGVGRKPVVPADVTGCRMALDRHAEAWLKWTAIARPLLPQDEVMVKLNTVDGAMLALRKQLSALNRPELRH